ncbi:MAG: spore cortex biosynthesis protein YabQ [Clostridia bacterium]|nr:spore cortex biosynthesis protein YabQ [Clostridia bacterium]
MITGYMHTVQLSVFIKSVGLGFLIGVLFSVLMFFNTVFGKKTFTVFLRDVLFFVSSAVLTFMFILEYNAGILRFYIFAGELIGFILFYIYPAEILRRFFASLCVFYQNTASRFKIVFAKRRKVLSSKLSSAVNAQRERKKVKREKRKNTIRKQQGRKRTKRNMKRKKIQKNG